MPFLCGTCAAGIAWLFRTVLKMRKENRVREEAVGAGLVALLSAALMDIYYRCSARGYATQEDRHNATRSYRAYHGLGANGEMTDVYQRILGMPLREEG